MSLARLILSNLIWISAILSDAGTEHRVHRTSHPPSISNMSFDDAVRPRQAPRYKDEDSSPTTPRELHGWYSYAIAAEVFAVVAVGKLHVIPTGTIGNKI